MTHAQLRKFCTSTAMSAVLVLGSTPAWAQAAAPPLDEPVSAPAPAAEQPVIELPEETLTAPASAPSTVSQPVVQQAPAAISAIEPPPRIELPPEEAAPVAAAASARRSAARAAAASPAPPQAAPASPAAAAPAVPPSVQPAASAPLAPPVVAPPPAVTVPSEGGDASEDGWTGAAAALAALLAALGLGGIAYVIGRSGRRRREAYHLAYDTEPTGAATASQGDGLTATDLEPEVPLPAFATVEDVIEEPAPDHAREDAVATIDRQRSDAPAFVMPAAGVPQTRTERDALLEKMVAAPPDEANPFTSRKRRMRRARLILQGLENEPQSEAQPFDWRTYKPSTSQPAPATPPRVTA